jgi:hypothetical protein
MYLYSTPVVDGSTGEPSSLPPTYGTTAPTLVSTSASCQTEFNDFAGCFYGSLDFDAQASCRYCSEVVAEEVIGHLRFVPEIECVRASNAACRAVEISCVPDVCQSCSDSHKAYMLCVLQERSVHAQGIGCEFNCDDGGGGPVAAAANQWNSSLTAWIGLALLLSVLRWTR